MAIRVGCGSWADPEYVGLLYPNELPANARLSSYARWFERVEVNSTYYATPPLATVAGWVAQTPPGFLFDLKLHRAFSQSPRAAADGGLLDRLLTVIQPLLEAQKLGALLLTLTPSFGPGQHRLEELDRLAEKLRPHRFAVELRHRGWVEPASTLATTLAYFRDRQLAWVAVDLPQLKSPLILPPLDEVTVPQLAYLRLHGRNPHYLKAKSAAERHQHDYTAPELKAIAARIRTLAAQAADVHVSLNNHASDFAPKAALALRRLLGQSVPSAL